MLLDMNNFDFRPTYCYISQIVEAPFGRSIYRSKQTSSAEHQKNYYFRKRVYIFVLASHFMRLKVLTLATLCSKSTRMICWWSWIFGGRRLLYQVTCRYTRWHVIDALVMVGCKLFAGRKWDRNICCPYELLYVVDIRVGDSYVPYTHIVHMHECMRVRVLLITASQTVCLNGQLMLLSDSLLTAPTIRSTLLCARCCIVWPWQTHLQVSLHS